MGLTCAGRSVAWQEVIACNIAHTPLDDASMNAVVLCLALMGTDYGAFLREVRPGPHTHTSALRCGMDASDGSASEHEYVRYGARCTRHSDRLVPSTCAQPAWDDSD